MSAVATSQPPQMLSTHPAHATRIRDLETAMPKVLPLYQAALTQPAAPAKRP
jgi:predicted Zn-dependent protease